jgi:catechol 2,3-dioxygenase-like lactoylglutathione lyase family enzyme
MAPIGTVPGVAVAGPAARATGRAGPGGSAAGVLQLAKVLGQHCRCSSSSRCCSPRPGARASMSRCCWPGCCCTTSAHHTSQHPRPAAEVLDAIQEGRGRHGRRARPSGRRRPRWPSRAAGRVGHPQVGPVGLEPPGQPVVAVRDESPLPTMVGRKEPTVPVQVSAIMLGVEDLNRSKQFYGKGLGCAIDQDHPTFVSFDLGGGRRRWRSTSGRRRPRMPASLPRAPDSGGSPSTTSSPPATRWTRSSARPWRPAARSSRRRPPPSGATPGISATPTATCGRSRPPPERRPDDPRTRSPRSRSAATATSACG